MQIIKVLIVLIIAMLPLLIWRESYQFDCTMLLMPLVVTVVIALGLIKFKHQQRLCLANCYAKTQSVLYYILAGKILVVIRAILVALILGLTLMVQVALWRIEILVLLWLDGLLLYLIYVSLSYGLSSQINEDMRNLIAKNWAVVINAILMLVVLANIQLYTTIPNYLDESLTQTIINATNHLRSECYYIQLIIQLSASYEATLWWLMVLGNQFMSNEVVKFSLWSLFLFGNGLAVWGYSRYLIEILGFATEQK